MTIFSGDTLEKLVLFLSKTRLDRLRFGKIHDQLQCTH